MKNDEIPSKAPNKVSTKSIKSYDKVTPYSCKLVHSPEYGVFMCGLRGHRVTCPCVNLLPSDATMIVDQSEFCPAKRKPIEDKELIVKICDTLDTYELLRLQELLDCSSDYMWEKVTELAKKQCPEAFVKPSKEETPISTPTEE
jgi:hypothetical protein